MNVTVNKMGEIDDGYIQEGEALDEAFLEDLRKGKERDRIIERYNKDIDLLVKNYNKKYENYLKEEGRKLKKEGGKRRRKNYYSGASNGDRNIYCSKYTRSRARNL